MYGTLSDTPPGDATGSQQPLDPSDDRKQADLEQRRRKKHILSHCHVQEGANGTPASVGEGDSRARRKLIAASIVCLLFMIGEIVGGVLSNSLAIATDAAHLLTDFASFMISLFALWLSSRPASKRMSFGWYRAEVVGALLSVLMIWLVTGLLVYMAIERLVTKQFEIDSTVMLATASAGLVVNIIMAFTLHDANHHHHHHHHGHGHSQAHLNDHDLANHSHMSHLHDDDHRQPLTSSGSPDGPFVSEKVCLTMDTSSSSPNRSRCSPEASNHHKRKANINVRAALIHVAGDFIQSLGVLVAALVIHFHPDYAIVDPICTFIFSFIVLLTTISILKDAINVLMEGMPDGINLIEVQAKLQQLPGVVKVHNLRIWSLSLDKIAISTHLVIDNTQTASDTLKLALETLRKQYNFFESTIQIEEYADEMKDCEQCQDEGIVVSIDQPTMTTTK